MPGLLIFALIILGVGALLALGPILFFLGQVAFALLIFILFFKFVALFSKIF